MNDKSWVCNTTTGLYWYILVLDTDFRKLPAMNTKKPAVAPPGIFIWGWGAMAQGVRGRKFADIVYTFWLQKQWKFELHTIYLWILDQYVSWRGLSDPFGGLSPIAHAWRRLHQGLQDETDCQTPENDPYPYEQCPTSFRALWRSGLSASDRMSEIKTVR